MCGRRLVVGVPVPSPPPGDFFEAVPRGGGVCVYKRVLHDRDDERCRLLLRRCREVIRAHGPPQGSRDRTWPGDGSDRASVKFADADDAAGSSTGQGMNTGRQVVPFTELVEAFGVRYVHVTPPEGGDLYVTTWGWPQLQHLMPSQWYTDKHYATHGKPLPGTSPVYRVPTRPVDGTGLDVVVKFSRVAQDVLLDIQATFGADIPVEVIAGARCNSPMEEFGLVAELRRGLFGPRELSMTTQRPLAIYVPEERHELWRLGRDQSTFFSHCRQLENEQTPTAKAIELDIRREYVLMYEWLPGQDALDFYHAGSIDEKEMVEVTMRAARDFKAKGFHVLDHKPRHVILQTDANNVLKRRHGQLEYGVVDFEFLQRTAEHTRLFKSWRRMKYWRQQITDPHVAASLPSHLRRVEILGIPYLEGATPDGGRLWVVGERPGLYDFFLPERWRRTPRTKLSSRDEVYLTGTRDAMHLVYRRSNVGIVPAVDATTPNGKRILAHGYNSPFEEVAIAKQLRERGVHVTHARAIYRTAHRSTRSEARQELVRPGDHIEPGYDYYTVWGYFRGIDPSDDPGRIRDFLDPLTARDFQYLSADETEALLERLRALRQASGLGAEGFDPQNYVLLVDDQGRLRRDANGMLVIAHSISLEAACHAGLLGETEGQRILQHAHERIWAAGFEKLDESARDLLLTLNAECEPQRDASGDLRFTLCSLSLVRKRDG